MPLSSLPSEDHFDDAFSKFENAFSISPWSADYPTEFMKSVLPIPCHSHNDYWRQRPLYSAIGSGCIGVEADVWDIGNDLFVAHDLAEVARERTLESMYIKPLVGILGQMNRKWALRSSPRGVFHQDPDQTLVLLVDFKRPEVWPILQQQLQSLRERDYLTHWNGTERISRPITVVASGDVPFDLLVRNTTYRGIFYDAPLDRLDDCTGIDCHLHASKNQTQSAKYNISNSYYASSSLSHAVGLLKGFAFTEAQTELLQQQIYDARERGLIPRYWGTPRWPRALRDEVWSVLVQAGVGVLNVDDLRAARKGLWGSWPRRSKQWLPENFPEKAR